MQKFLYSSSMQNILISSKNLQYLIRVRILLKTRILSSQSDSHEALWVLFFRFTSLSAILLNLKGCELMRKVIAPSHPNIQYEIGTGKLLQIFPLKGGNKKTMIADEHVNYKSQLVISCLGMTPWDLVSVSWLCIVGLALAL